MNTKKIFIILIALMASLSVLAQKPDYQKIKSLKIAFLTERLNLSTQEAQEFWPLYNAYTEQREAQWRKGRKIFGAIKESENLNDAEASDLLKKYIAFEYEEEKLEMTFYQKVEKAVSAKKTMLLIRAEEDFKRQMIRQFNKKKENNR
ncbi:hypothetical protein [Pareuzebyella sediminis]|uniref:hypothetical protein n=1 Tax=Pareuzebyella sediminis TaxID=2607998 RepID=UPI0011F00313|nr:hypothetical protein [Pareuzebyella sediminis]